MTLKSRQLQICPLWCGMNQLLWANCMKQAFGPLVRQIAAPSGSTTGEWWAPLPKVKQILCSNCVPDLSGHPRVTPPILWQRAPSREEIHSHINHCYGTNSCHKYVIITTPSQHFAWGGGRMTGPVCVYNNAPEHRPERIDATGNGIKCCCLTSLYLR